VLKQYLENNFPGGPYLSAYEVGFCGFSVHYELESAGIRNIVFNPADINDTQKERSRKTDAVDCIKICRNLMNDELKAIYVPSREELGLRGYLSARDTAVKKQRVAKQRIKSLLNRNGVKIPDELFPTSKTHWSRHFNGWLEQVAADLGSGEGYRLNDLLKDLHHAHSQVLAAGRRLNEVISAHHMDTNELLLSIPGIGRVTAARICLEVPHASNFVNSDHLASYIGFVPDVHGSDDNVYVRGITYRRRVLLRSAFVESSWRAIGKDPAMGLAYSNYIKRGMKPNNAIIRIARKLVNRVFFVLRERKRYEIARVR
jgi:transposase